MNPNDKRSSTALSGNAILWDVATLVVPLIGLLPWLAIETQRVLGSSYGMFFPFAWVVLAGLVLLTKRSVTTDRNRQRLAIACLIVALLVGMAAVGKFRPALAQAALGFCFIGWGLVRLHSVAVTRVVALSTLLFMTIPLPGVIYKLSETWGIACVARFASPILDMFRVFHLYESPILKLREHTFDLQEIMLHPVSVQLMIVVAIIFSLARRRSLAVGLMNCLSAGVWTLFGQLVLVIVLAIASQNSIDLTARAFHHNMALCGIALFAIVAILLSDAFWSSMLAPITEGGDNTLFRSGTANLFNWLVDWPRARGADDSVDEMPEESQPLVGKAPLGAAAPLGLLIGLLSVPSTLALMKNDLLFNTRGSISVKSSQFPDAKTIPEDFIVGQSLRRYRGADPASISGEFGGNWTWKFIGTGSGTEVRFRFPVRGWSDAFAFEEAQMQWTRSNFTLQNDDSGWPWSESILKHPNGGNAYHWSSQLLLSGSPYVPTEDEFGETMNAETSSSGLLDLPILELINPKQDTVKKWTAQISMVYEVGGEVREVERQRMLAKFLEARRLLRNRMFASPETATPVPAN